ncbi:MAG TPA: hypothetical protein VHZ50_17795 [Puia sp.]|jgi:hypothetical protein|nr:hypothetical protein [Puia sp.]
MKKSIALAALLLVIGTSVFAAAPAKSTGNSKDEIAFVPLKSDAGFGIQIAKASAGNSSVIVYNNTGDVIFKDLLTKGASGTKGYIVNSLETGDYTVEVVSKGQSVKKQMHIYDDGQAKSYFFYQD